MTVGPVQLLVLGFEKPAFRGEVLAELERLRESDIVRVVDGLAVYKDAAGSVTSMEIGQLNADENAEFGALVGALTGLGAAGDEGMSAGAKAGANAGAQGRLLPRSEIVEVLSALPTESAAALLLIEHRWAIPLREALLRVGGSIVQNTWVSAADLDSLGIASRQDVGQDTPARRPRRRSGLTRNRPQAPTAWTPFAGSPRTTDSSSRSCAHGAPAGDLPSGGSSSC